MQLLAIKNLEGSITLKTGLHIGAGDLEMHIGGTDQPIVKHPHTQEPYIPGSSLKGKVRALLELKSGLMGLTNGSPVAARNINTLQDRPDDQRLCENLVKLFGSGGSDMDEFARLGPTRASFSDCYLDESWRDYARENRLPLVEVKSENTINRITGTAQHPRFTERATVGCRFKFSVSLKVFEGDEGETEALLLQGLRLLELDALGGSGSRGYGRVSIQFDDPSVESRFRELTV